MLKKSLLVLFTALTAVLASFSPVYAGQTSQAGYIVNNNPNIANLYESFRLPNPEIFASDGSAFCISENMNTQDLPSYGTATYRATGEFCAPTTPNAQYLAYINVYRNGILQLSENSGSVPLYFPFNDTVVLSMNYQPGSLTFGFYDPAFGKQYTDTYNGYGGNGYHVSTIDAEMITSFTDATVSCQTSFFDIPDVIVSANGQSDAQFAIQSPDWNHVTQYTSEDGNPSVILLQPINLTKYWANGYWQSSYRIESPGTNNC